MLTCKLSASIYAGQFTSIFIPQFTIYTGWRKVNRTIQTVKQPGFFCATLYILVRTLYSHNIIYNKMYIICLALQSVMLGFVRVFAFLFQCSGVSLFYFFVFFPVPRIRCTISYFIVQKSSHGYQYFCLKCPPHALMQTYNQQYHWLIE